MLPQNVKPSTSTVANVAIGAPLGIVVVYVVNLILRANGMEDLPGEVAGAVGALVAGLAGLPFSGGRSQDTV